MFKKLKLIRSKIAGLLLVIIPSFLGGDILAAKSNIPVLEKLKEIELTTEGRLGIFAVNIENGHVIAHCADEVFPTGCTSKAIGVAAVLKKSMSNPSLLTQIVKYSKTDLERGGYSPITEKHVSDGMSIQALCAASISQSDNVAMNLLLGAIGGVQGMNDFARSIGDTSFRQDSDWPAEAYSGGKGNVRDSSTPRAMVESLQKITLGKLLDSSQREMFTTWLINTQTGAARIRSGIPSKWMVGNKTGTGGAYGTTNDIAIVWPPRHAPMLIGIYYTSDNENALRREDVLSFATKVIIEEFVAKDNSLNAGSDPLQ